MNFFVDLWNFIRCAFCSRRNCNSRFSVGSRHYCSGLGFVRTSCPKKHRHEILTVKEIRKRMLEEAEKEENKND